MVAVTPEEFAGLAEDWTIHLRNRNKSRNTIAAYQASLDAFTRWAERAGVAPELTRRNAERFTAALMESGQASSTAYVRQSALRRFSAWLLEEGEIPADELVGLKSPKVDQKVVEHLTPEEIRALLRACDGRTFTAVRDTAIVRFMHSTGARAEEVISMRVIDLQVGARSAVIVRGKGGRGRRSGFGDRTAEALARYLRARRRHPLADRPELWLAGAHGRKADGVRGVMSYAGLRTTMERRAEAAGVQGFHLHRLRHTCAVDWLAKGGTVSGLMSQCGWISVEMVQRYVEAAASELAVAEAQRLAVDDI